MCIYGFSPCPSSYHLPSTPESLVILSPGPHDVIYLFVSTTSLKDAKLKSQAIEVRALRAKVKYLQEEVQKIRKDDIVIAADAEGDQGRRLHKALSGEEPKKLFDKLPEGTLARAVVDVSCLYVLWCRIGVSGGECLNDNAPEHRSIRPHGRLAYPAITYQQVHVGFPL